MEVHETPYLVKGNLEMLREGNVHSVEPGVYMLNKFGVRIEDDVVVRVRGGERLSKVTRRQWEL